MSKDFVKVVGDGTNGWNNGVIAVYEPDEVKGLNPWHEELITRKDFTGLTYSDLNARLLFGYDNGDGEETFAITTYFFDGKVRRGYTLLESYDAIHGVVGIERTDTTQTREAFRQMNALLLK